MSTPQQLSSFNNFVIPRYTIKNISAGGSYTVTGADNGVILNYIGSTAITINLAPAVTLGPGFSFQVWGSSTSVITVDPNGAEYMNGPFNNTNGDSTYVMNGGTCQFTTDGVRWRLTSFSHVGTYQGGVVIGNGASGTNNYTIAIGQSAASTSPYATALGYNAQATSSYAIAIGYSASASSGSGAMAIGYSASATGAYSVCLGQNYSLSNPSATGAGSVSIQDGSSTSSTATNSMAVQGGATTIIGQYAYAGGDAGTTSQISNYLFRIFTTDATATVMTTSRNNVGNVAASTNNQVILRNNSAYNFTAYIVARQKAANGTATASWKIEGLIRREASAAATVLVNSITTVISNIPGWTIAVSADTSNGGLAITATGAAATNIAWFANVQTAEITYA